MNRFLRFVGAWLCRKGWHKRRVVEVLTGGRGPDGAAEAIECARPGCGAYGWTYCRGDTKWISRRIA